MKRILFALILTFTLTSFNNDCFYYYRAKVVYVYDGDTPTLDIDQGLDTRRSERIRMIGIDAPELRGPEKAEGYKSRDALSKLILGQEVVLVTDKDKRGKYGRLLGTIYFNDVNVNEWMINHGHAEVY